LLREQTFWDLKRELRVMVLWLCRLISSYLGTWLVGVVCNLALAKLFAPDWLMTFVYLWWKLLPLCSFIKLTMNIYNTKFLFNSICKFQADLFCTFVFETKKKEHTYSFVRVLIVCIVNLHIVLSCVFQLDIILTML